MDITTKVFKIFACCLPVKGARRSIICDVQRNTYDFIPNKLYEILKLHDGKSISFIKNFYKNTNNDVIDEYFNFLEKKEYIFYCEENEKSNFPVMDLTWERPELITNSIIDINNNSIKKLNYKEISKQLDLLSCKALQIRSFKKINLQNIDILLSAFSESRLRHIDLLLKFDKSWTLENYEELCRKYPRIHFLVIHSSPEEKSIKVTLSNAMVSHIKDKIESSSHCGVVKTDFYPNLDMYTESLSYNSCLNKKISIDEDGEIKNCPSMKASYGNIQTLSLYQALSTKNFKKYWNINKDQISICQDCEFRYICIDCRAFIADEKDLYSKPLKCNYNPYEAVWE